MAKTFPSPIGELHFSIILLVCPGRSSAVSVPYRGATFLNYNANFNHFCSVVSVPYRGATFLNFCCSVYYSG